MPLYPYRCNAGHVTELRRTPEDASRDATCDQCGQPARREYRLGGISFRGPGFHNTDNPHRGRRLRG